MSALRRDCSGVAFLEFALALPFVLGATMAAAELTNFTTTKMRVSQVALHLADDGSRIGTGDLLSTKQITEAQINDLLIGADLQAGALGLYGHGRVILSSLEPVANPNPTDRYRIRWQRCRGSKSWSSHYGVQGDTNLIGLVLNGQTLKAPASGAIIYVEVAYDYQPIIGARWLNMGPIVETAAMSVRDNREFAGPTGGVGIYNDTASTVATCS
ncbi:pilus assembly protein [Sphingobium aromaticiconvertens]|uniref:TadE/TadG family type IV pilus assembly protein n=1 Tax=Sphingobium aromaticiconvertens TaxID=365341 RepID=UPI003017EF84